MPYSDLNTPQQYADFDERWKWLVSYMVLEDMFVHEILMMLYKAPTKSIKTMGVRIENSLIHLGYNLDFINTLTDPELRYVLTHEIFHVVLHHCCVRLPEDKKDRKLYNIAADLAINCLIPQDANRHMPKYKDGPQKGKNIGLLPTKEPYNFPDKLSMEQYVMLLKEKQDRGEDIGDDGQGEGGDGYDNHDGWDDADAEIIKQEIRNKIEEISKRANGWGHMPGDVQQLVLAAQKSSIRWWRHLRHFFGNLVTSRVESTFKKPNRRYGYPYCGTKKQHTDRKLLAVDRSGSCMTGEDQAHFLAEVNRLAEIQPVDLVSFDVGIHGKVIPFNRRHAQFNYQGGSGGTSFKEIFELAEARRYQSIIILTDGEAEAIPKPRYVKDILWVLTNANCKPPVPWGRRVHIVPKGVNQPGAPVDSDTSTDPVAADSDD
jgi:predicted metal-dependent peptidase